MPGWVRLVPLVEWRFFTLMILVVVNMHLFTRA